MYYRNHLLESLYSMRLISGVISRHALMMVAELSNILVENAIRPVAIGRKNFIFAGSHSAAERAAMIYSLITTAKNQP